MSKIVRWSPFREMMNLRDEFDRFFDESLGTLPPTRWERTSSLGLALDLTETEDNFVVKASVPGIKPDDLEVTLTDNVLTIKGERKEETEVNQDSYHLRERRFGSFCRSVPLPVKVNEDKIDAEIDNGVLTIIVAKAEEVKPKRIAINVHDSRKTIEG